MNSAGRFTHLEVHSHFTLLGGTASVSELVDRAVGENMKSLALTDSNALYGVVSFARCCREANINPILGVTVTMAPPD
ncbi:MAG: PHP domain-containing protein, partial [Anaerolineales bacterium]|nr:PHP domain-containing protein [Anaerolineales bacterium]